MHHIRNDNSCGHEYTLYDDITFVQLCHVLNISNDTLCGTEQILLKFIYNAVQIQLF